ncbi:hypothetical protein BsWGS_25938 [Bradybaena similaris]
MAVARPWIVWNSDRSQKESITASSLQELIEKGCSKLGLSPTPQLRVVLEEDGTEVDEEDYFSFLPGDTSFLFLQNNEQKQPGETETETGDETGASNVASVDEDVIRMATSLRSGIRNLLTFSPEQLQKLVDQDTSQLARLIREKEWYAGCLQGACQRRLDALAENKELDRLLKLYWGRDSRSGRATSDDETSDDEATMDSATSDEAIMESATSDEAIMESATSDVAALNEAALDALALDALALDKATSDKLALDKATSDTATDI